MKQALAVFGTASDVGKSIIATALCRLFANKGIKVAPFKAQNMSNNAFVTKDSKEMGVAQAIQANASKIQPTVDMNPILLKPSSQKGSQIILQGDVLKETTAKEYFKNTSELFEKAKSSFDRLRKDFDMIVIEGAGSCAEVNLKGRDFANFKTAHYANADVVLVADIDKGGVFAQIIGTLECLDKKDKELIKGIIINKFRGDKELFKDGIEYIEKKTNIPILGVLPAFYDISIDKEDSLSIDNLCDKTKIEPNKINTAVIRLPRISNFTDFAPFMLEESVLIHYISKPKQLGSYDAVIIPGSKNTVSDLEWMKKIGFDRALKEYAKNGGHIFGICGGYQMLGEKIEDPDGVESNQKETQGLKLLNIKTVLENKKTLTNIEGFWIDANIPISGYEIHMGKTENQTEPAIKITKKDGQKTEKFDGSCKNNICGCYIHGIFDDYEFRHYFLKQVSEHKFKHPNKTNYQDFKDGEFDKLAKWFKSNIDMEKLMDIVGA
jgi:adenosylcobyric acid synthase